MPAILTLDSLSYRTPDGRSLFDDLTLAFGAERTGLVGRNGAGKTSLLRLAVGELSPGGGAGQDDHLLHVLVSHNPLGRDRRKTKPITETFRRAVDL